jgi:hypothetical protein
MSQSTISCIWRAFSLTPHRAETFRLSRDPLFIDKVRDVGFLGSSRLRAKSFILIGVPDGIRTHVIAVKGRCPGPD